MFISIDGKKGMSYLQKNKQKKQEEASICLNAVYDARDDLNQKSDLLIEKIDLLRGNAQILEQKIAEAMKDNLNDEANRYYNKLKSAESQISLLQADLNAFDNVLQTIDNWVIVLRSFYTHHKYKEIIKQVPVEKLSYLIEKNAMIGQINDFVVKGYNSTLEKKRIMEENSKRLRKGIRRTIEVDKNYEDINKDLVEEEKRKKEMEAISNKYAQVVIPNIAEQKNDENQIYS